MHIEPNNPLILDALGETLLEIGQPDEAKKISFHFPFYSIPPYDNKVSSLTTHYFLLKSVEIAPQEGYSKYMNLGQIFQVVDKVELETVIVLTSM